MTAKRVPIVDMVMSGQEGSFLIVAEASDGELWQFTGRARLLMNEACSLVERALKAGSISRDHWKKVDCRLAFYPMGKDPESRRMRAKRAS